MDDLLNSIYLLLYEPVLFLHPSINLPSSDQEILSGCYLCVSIHRIPSLFVIFMLLLFMSQNPLLPSSSLTPGLPSPIPKDPNRLFLCFHDNLICYKFGLENLTWDLTTGCSFLCQSLPITFVRVIFPKSIYFSHLQVYAYL